MAMACSMSHQIFVHSENSFRRLDHTYGSAESKAGPTFLYFTALTYSLVNAHDSIAIVYFISTNSHTLFQKTYHKLYKLACTLEDTLLELCRRRATSH
uniref:Uncharacterized protein n=1 Tax=Rhipicephalus zambeziensis TaxID=60191 RepID=A0A224Y514_9ACAR